ncbi:polysaccharide biosynthesis protein, partial [Staphylococcus aureus]
MGSEIVRQLIQYKPECIILNDSGETPLHDLKLELDELGFTNYELALGDIRNISVVDDMFTKHKPNYVYHAAAYKHVPMM